MLKGDPRRISGQQAWSRTGTDHYRKIQESGMGLKEKPKEAEGFI